MTVTTAFTTSMLAWGLLTFPKGYARAGETKHALEAVKWGADYLLKTFHPETGRKGGFTMVYQVGNLTTDFDTWSSPENMTAREVRRPAAAATARRPRRPRVSAAGGERRAPRPCTRRPRRTRPAA